MPFDGNRSRERGESDSSNLRRRKMLQALGVSVTSAGLAGCGGQDAGSGGEDPADRDGSPNEETEPVQSDGGEGAPVDDTLSLTQSAVPTDSQYNPWNGKNFPFPNLMLYDRLLYYNLETKEYGPFALSDWEFTGDAMKLTIRDGQTWHDGADVTAEDLVIQLKLDMYTGGTLKDSVESIAKDVIQVDEKTVEIQFDRSYNEQIMLGRLRDKRIFGYREVYGKHLEAIESASSDEEQNSAISDLQSFSYNERPPIGNGAFRWEDADPQRTLAVKFEEHPDADNINFPQMEWKYLESNQAAWQATINDDIDGEKGTFMPENQLNQLPDHVKVVHIPLGWGVGIVPNWENEHLQKRDVRKAVMHVINRQEAATNAAGGTGTKIPVTYPSGLNATSSGRTEDHWLDGVADQFETYGPESSQTDKAAELLGSAGYEQNGETWVDSESGEQLAFSMKGPGGWSDWMSAGRTAASHLESFGISTEVQGIDTSTYWGQDYENSNFDLALQGVALHGYTYPFFDLDYIYRSYDAVDIWGVPSSFDNVETLGGETTSMNPGELITDLASSGSGSDEEVELVQRLAYLTNQTIPAFPMVVKLRQSVVTTDDWNTPSIDSEKMQVLRPQYILPQLGEWAAKTE